jgi:hypothetical protein
MDGPAWGDVGNVVPLRRDYFPQDAESRAHAWSMSDAVRSFDRLERCAAALRSGPLGTAREIDGVGWPIVSFQVELPAVHHWLDQLESINVVNWPDPRWALKLGAARSDAVLRLRAVSQSLYDGPPGTGTLDGRLAADIQQLADALCGLRELIVAQCPEVLCVPSRVTRDG